MLMHWLVLAAAIWVTAAVLPGVQIKDALSAVVIAAVFSVLNVLLGWLIFVLLGVVTLGIGFWLAVVTQWVVNAIVLSLTSKVTGRLKIDSFGWALAAAACITFVSNALTRFFHVR